MAETRFGKICSVLGIIISFIGGWYRNLPLSIIGVILAISGALFLAIYMRK